MPSPQEFSVLVPVGAEAQYDDIDRATFGALLEHQLVTFEPDSAGALRPHGTADDEMLLQNLVRLR